MREFDQFSFLDKYPIWTNKLLKERNFNTGWKKKGETFNPETSAVTATVFRMFSARAFDKFILSTNF